MAGQDRGVLPELVHRDDFVKRRGLIGGVRVADVHEVGRVGRMAPVLKVGLAAHPLLLLLEERPRQRTRGGLAVGGVVDQAHLADAVLREVVLRRGRCAVDQVDVRVRAGDRVAVQDKAVHVVRGRRGQLLAQERHERDEAVLVEFAAPVLGEAQLRRGDRHAVRPGVRRRVGAAVVGGRFREQHHLGQVGLNGQVDRRVGHLERREEGEHARLGTRGHPQVAHVRCTNQLGPVAALGRVHRRLVRAGRPPHALGREFTVSARIGGDRHTWEKVVNGTLVDGAYLVVVHVYRGADRLERVVEFGRRTTSTTRALLGGRDVVQELDVGRAQAVARELGAGQLRVAAEAQLAGEVA